MKENTRTLLAMLAVSALGSAAMMLAPSIGWADALGFVSSIAISFLVFVWYRIDARERRYPRRWPLNFGIAGASLLVMPYYLFRTRGALGGALAVGGFVLGFLALCLASIVGSLLGLLVRFAAGMPMPPGLE